MITIPAGVHIYLACGVTDMRKGFDSLSLLAQEVLKQNPFAGHLFAFRGRWGDLIKILYWDGQGFCLFAKRLEKGRFSWPVTKEGAVTLTPAQLASEWDALNPRKEPPWAQALQFAAQSLADLRDAVKAAEAELEVERQRHAVAARREAILKELAALGYEIREGLQTALAKDGKVVVRKAAHPNYGVEVIAPEKGDKLSFRAVTFGQGSAPRNKARDADMEVLWCRDFEKL